MANRYAVASGNWSSTATWDGGTLPTSADIVRPNNFNVTIDQDITVQALRNNATAPAIAGGTFILTGDFTVNISIDIQCFATNLFIYNGTGTAYITGLNPAAQIVSSTTTNSTSTVTHSGTGHLIVDMLINSCIVNENFRVNITVTGGGTLTCLKQLAKGSISNPPGNSGTSAVLVNTVGGAILNLKDIVGTGGNGYTVNSSVLSTINIVGTITGNTLTVSGTPQGGALFIGGNDSILNINGTITNTFQSGGGGFLRTVYITSTCTVTMIGNINAGASSSTTTCMVLSNLGALLNFTGDVIGAGGINCISSIGGVNITGNVIGSSSTVAVSTSGICTIIGTITGGTGNGAVGVNISGGTFNHIGTIQASAFASGITCNTPTTTNLTCTGPFLRNGYTVAVASQTLRINALYNPYFEFRKSDGTDVTYVDSSSLNFPITSNVRQGITYGGGLYTGTLIMAVPSNVSLGIPTDATVGTAEITAADFLTTLSTSLDPLAVRLRNVSTVASIGKQLASYNI